LGIFAKRLRWRPERNPSRFPPAPFAPANRLTLPRASSDKGAPDEISHTSFRQGS
jgi:hypothetical protein